MDFERSQTVTQLLNELSGGRAAAAEELFPLVYDDLRDVARAYFVREKREHTLQPTALVHEAYMKLVGRDNPPKNQAHFRALAARAMRTILIDHARRRDALRRGGDRERVALSAVATPGIEREIDVLALNEVLERLAGLDRPLHDIVEMRFFAGLSELEIAEVLELSRTTVQKKWRAAKAWLSKELRNSDS